jgi:glucose-1-phosphate thymidylyltransferase
LKEPWKIAIPMAGLGTRMRPHTWSKPKPLIHLAGRTVLDYVLDQFSSLPRFKDAEFVLIMGPNQEDQVVPHMKANHPEKKVHYFTQTNMKGQSDALYLARDVLKGPMLMAFSDTLIETELCGLDDEPSDGIAWVKPVPDPRRFGVAEVGNNNLITRLIEKPEDITNNLAVVGFYYFRSGEALMDAIRIQMEKHISLNGEYFLVDAINLMISSGAKLRVQEVVTWLDAGKPEALLETNRHLLENGAANSAEAAKRKGISIIPPVYIHPEAELHDCVVGPYVAIGRKAILSRSIIQNSIVEQEAEIDQMVLENSLIGRQAGIKGRAESINIGDNSWIEM